MKAVVLLWRSYLRRDRALLAAMAFWLLAFEVLLVLVARSVDTGPGYAALAEIAPDFVKQALGFDLTLLLSFRGAVALGYLHPVALASLAMAAVAIGRRPVSEIASRTVELLATRPLGRPAPFAASLLESATAAAVLPLAMLAGTLLGLGLTGDLAATPLWPYARMAGSAALFLASLAGLSLLVAAASTRGRSYMQAVVTLIVASYAVDWLGRLWKPLAPLARLSVFHYFQPLALLTGGSAQGLWVLAAIALAASLAALAVAERRDL